MFRRADQDFVITLRKRNLFLEEYSIEIGDVEHWAADSMPKGQSQPIYAMALAKSTVSQWSADVELTRLDSR